VICVPVKVKLTVLLLCVCVHSAWKGRPRNDLYCVGWDVKPYSLTHKNIASLFGTAHAVCFMGLSALLLAYCQLLIARWCVDV